MINVTESRSQKAAARDRKQRRLQIYTCCHLAITLCSEWPLTTEELANEAVTFGGRWDITKDECLEMLQKPLFRVLT